MRHLAPLTLLLLAAILSGDSFSFEGTQRWLADPALNHTVRKTLHFVGYATLGLALFASVRRFRLSLLCLVLLSGLDELHQSFTLTRTGCLADVALDSAGGLTALLAARTRTIRWPSANAH